MTITEITKDSEYRVTLVEKAAAGFEGTGVKFEKFFCG